MTILLAAGDCFEAFLLAPVAEALQQRAVGFRFACCPCEELDLTGADQASISLSGDRPLAEFVMDLIAAGPATIVISGSSEFALAVANAASRAHRRVVLLDAGVRSSGLADASRREAEGAAQEWLCDGETERRELLRDGRPHHAVRTVGSLMAAGASLYDLAATNDPTMSNPFAFVALERLNQTARDSVLRTTSALSWEFTFPYAESSRSWRSQTFSRVFDAAWLLTDSVGYQRFAIALGLPCVVMPNAAVWAPGVATGRVTQAGFGDQALAAAITRIVALPRAASLPGEGVADRIVDALRTPPAAGEAAPLPSDADASGRTLGDDEIALVTAVLRSGTLNSTRGTMVTLFEQRFAQWLGRKHAIACASGSAAVHCAIAALQLQPGDEVVTTPITDMGALTPILYEGAVPVFADVDPRTLNVTAATVEAQLTARTRAIVVTHLFGLPADLDGIRALAEVRGIALIEDAAQAFGATWGGRKVGTFGAIAAFSLQQGKHITSGEGGVVATDDDALARRVFLYVNKAWGYGDKQPDHYFPALNYRLTELQGAVLVAQLPKLDAVIAARRAVAAGLRQTLGDVPGLLLPDDPSHGTHSYWKFAFFVDDAVVPGGALALGKRMQQLGIACVPRYIQKPAFECELFRDWRRSPVTWLPLQHNPRRERAGTMFARADYPGATDGLEHVIVLPINERYTDAHVAYVAGRIREAIGALQHG